MHTQVQFKLPSLLKQSKQRICKPESIKCTRVIYTYRGCSNHTALITRTNRTHNGEQLVSDDFPNASITRTRVAKKALRNSICI